MNDLYYLRKAVKVPDSTLYIVAMSKDLKPYALKEHQITSEERYDLPVAFSLIPYLTRKAETGEDVPDYEGVQEAIKKATEQLASIV